MIHEDDVLVCICDRREVSVISHRPVTRSKKGWVFCGSVSKFLQLVVAIIIEL